MTTPRDPVREAAERVAREWLRENLPAAAAASHWWARLAAEAMYERGHADATAASAARVGELEGLLREVVSDLDESLTLEQYPRSLAGRIFAAPQGDDVSDANSQGNPQTHEKWCHNRIATLEADLAAAQRDLDAERAAHAALKGWTEAALEWAAGYPLGGDMDEQAANDLCRRYAALAAPPHDDGEKGEEA